MSGKDSKYKHDYGMQIISEICEKHGGTFTWKVENNELFAGVIWSNE